jgi:hypothetical protein
VGSKAAFATCRAGFLATPLMRTTFLVRNLAALAGNLALLLTVHRREPSIFFAHNVPLRKSLEPPGGSQADVTLM